MFNNVFLGKKWKKMEMNGFTCGIMKVDIVINASNWVDVFYSGPLFVSQFSFFFNGMVIWHVVNIPQEPFIFKIAIGL
jgi:hypothetical protein